MDTFLVTIAITLLLSLSPAPSVTAQFVLDGAGKPVRNGGSYYIYPDMMAPDETSISWTNNTDKSKPCPIFVSRGIQQVSPLTTVTISSPIRFPFILLGTPVSLSFDDTNTPCEAPLEWSLKPDGSIDASYLVAGDNTNKPWHGSFVVENAQPGTPKYTYKLQFCTEKKCLDVGSLPKGFGITPDTTINLEPLNFSFGASDSSSYIKMKKVSVA